MGVIDISGMIVVTLLLCNIFRAVNRSVPLLAASFNFVGLTLELLQFNCRWISVHKFPTEDPNYRTLAHQPSRFTLRDVGKLFQLAERGGCTMNPEGRQALEHGIEIGRGGIWLNLTADQYAQLTQT